MRTLCYLRHGQADRSQYTGKDDALRPLTGRGPLRAHSSWEA
ncbi:MAG: hypothetical protein AB7V45_03460 [Candidatus Krumholzibacteriia bacterium]